MASNHLTTKKYLRFLGVTNPSSLFSEDELTWMNNWLNGEMEVSHRDIDWPNIELNNPFNVDFQKPFVDLFVRQRLLENKCLPENLWPHNADFAVCLSHDIDRWESYSPKVFLRNLKKRKFHSSTIRSHQKLTFQILKTGIKRRLTKKSSDPLWCYEKWIELEKKHARTGTYFIFARPDKAIDIHENDCDYTFDDEIKYDGKTTQIKSVLKKWSSEGIELGIHGSIGTATSKKLFADLNNKLEETIHKKVRLSRQHYLNFKLPETLLIQSQNGIEIDSSIGFNKFSGFRLGTSFPVYLHHQQSSLLEIPLILMDSSMFLQRSLSAEIARKEILTVIERVKSVNGCLTINFHPDYVDRPLFFETYSYLLKVLSEYNCTFMNMTELKEHLDKKCVG